MKMSKIQDNKHFFAVVAQCKNPYREFSYCERCKQYRTSDTRGFFGKIMFIALAIQLKDEGNPMYEPDSDKLLEF